MIAYEQRLNQDVWWALREGSTHFEKASAIHKTLVKIARRFDDMGIPYALAGALPFYSRKRQSG